MCDVFNTKAPKVICPKILSIVQILYQNNEIDIRQKNKIIELLKMSMKTNDMTELNSYFRFLSVGSSLTNYFEQCITLTQN